MKLVECFYALATPSSPLLTLLFWTEFDPSRQAITAYLLTELFERANLLRPLMIVVCRASSKPLNQAMASNPAFARR